MLGKDLKNLNQDPIFMAYDEFEPFYDDYINVMVEAFKIK
jgi:hypothetical protein